MKFFQAFEDLNCTEKLTETFYHVEVERIVMSRSLQVVKIYMVSEQFIPRSSVREMEYQLKRQIFSRAGVAPRLLERYSVPEECAFSELFGQYRDAFLEDLKEQSILDYQIFKRSTYTIERDTLTLNTEENLFTHSREDEIKSLVTAVFSEKFGFDIQVVFDYYLPETEEKEAVSVMDVATARRYAQGSGNIQQGRGGRVGKGAAKKQKELAAQNYEKGTEATAGTKNNSQQRKIENNHAAHAGGNNASYRKKQNDPDIFYGRPFEGAVVPIIDIQDEIGDVVIQGKIQQVDERELRSGKFMILFTVSDFTDTISVKLFLKPEQRDELKEKLKKGAFVKLAGNAQLDKFDKEIGIISVQGIKSIPDFTKKRVDNSKKKRVELHAHTMMSDMDAVVDVKDLIGRAKNWGHKAIAVTDHGVVQAFPDANHAVKPDEDFKIIYGVEAYLVDDCKDSVANDKGQSFDVPTVVFDIETTGFGPVKDKIIEIGAVKVINGQITEKFSTFINPEISIPEEITKLTSITDEMVRDAETIETVLPRFLSFAEGCVLVAHNASFDVGFIRKKAELLKLPFDVTSVDTVAVARILRPGLSNYKLHTVCKEFEVSLENHHRAVDDAGATAELYVKFIEILKEKGKTKLSEIDFLREISPEVIKKMPTYHAIILAKNNTGRINLYKLVSLSHLTYFSRRPRIPKSLFLQNREGLLIGSACEAGELYQALLRNEPEWEIERLVHFYDYLEIQPLGNNNFMIASDKHDIRSIKDLEDKNREIVALGEKYHKLVVGTCDVHFLDPEDEVYRRIIMSGKGFKDADNQAPLYLRTTEEMLAEFAYLGKEKAEEIVVTNTNLIADMIEKISPVRPDKCPPVIENSDEDLRRICYDKAHSIYGENLPVQVEERLEKELKSIIGNGFAVMYIIAQKLVWKSNEDGYLVGSRGSVGSSFAATMSGITEVNPLSAHYYCENCHYTDFDSEEVKAFAGKSGCDMPDKNCPVCGAPLCKDGHEIPFETFLGFYGDKEPDIDLNFSGEYQSKAHDYTEVIFGKGQTFRAGTIGTLADKTAFGMVKRYYEEHGQHCRVPEINRLVQGCVGVRRTTGQHPGGIVVLPIGEEIYSFTPVQHPANDMDTNIITTHFDYHSIDHNLLKLDILGHDDPSMIRMLEDLTGVNAQEIRMDDQKVLSLFVSTEALGITPADIGGCDLGSLGVPEFGTDFVMQMLRDTKPQSFSDLVRISGLSHGTDVWLGNAQYYIQNGDCTLSTAICTRDDIMTFLIHSGVENGLAFKIMESVRKGKGLTPQMEEAMLEKGIPAWYIESCKKIKYMFPKAHAAAYVMMALRIAYFKVYYPCAYYAAYFSIRASAFNYELMCFGRAKLEEYMADFKRRSAELSKKEQDVIKDMRIVQEMYARGIEFMPIDIYRATAHRFQIIDGKLMPSFSSIDGMGDKAAEGLAEAAKAGNFLSRDEIREKAKISQTLVDTMYRLGILASLPESNQLSLFDFMG